MISHVIENGPQRRIKMNKISETVEDKLLFGRTMSILEWGKAE